ncbi:hypothetical protein Tco_1374256 [Tanacetum coccineum]
MVSIRMDDATRQFINEAIQEAITTAMTAIQQRIDGVCLRQETLATEMQNQNNGQVVGGNQANRVNSYGRLTKLAFPRFNVRIASIHLYDKALDWHRNFERRNGLEVTWESKVDITESQAISMFLGGMNTDIALIVRMFKPRTLIDIYCLANLQEAIIESRNKSKPVYVGYRNVASTSSSSNVSTRNNKPFLALPAPKQTFNAGRKQLSKKEYEKKGPRINAFTVIKSEECLEEYVTEEISLVFQEQNL